MTPPSANDAAERLTDASKALQRGFGQLSDSASARAQSAIQAAAARFKEKSNDRIPRRKEIIDELDKVQACARELVKALNSLSEVSAAWLTGGLRSPYDPLPRLPTARLLPVSRPVSPGTGNGGDQGRSRADATSTDGWNAPEVLREDRKFLGALKEAFKAQAAEWDARRDEKLKKQVEAAGAAKRLAENARTAGEYEQGLLEINRIAPNFDQRRDLIEPLAEQMKNLATIAFRARKKYDDVCPADGGGQDSPHSFRPLQTSLAIDCWGIVARFYGNAGFLCMKTTPNGAFSTFVKEVARYALNVGKLSGNSQFDAAVRETVRNGSAWVEQERKAGRDPFVVHRRSEHFRRP
jgi:hypothetical protein